MAKPARPSAVRADDLLEGDVTEWGVVKAVVGKGSMVDVVFEDNTSIGMDRAYYVDIEN